MNKLARLVTVAPSHPYYKNIIEATLRLAGEAEKNIKSAPKKLRRALSQAKYRQSKVGYWRGLPGVFNAQRKILRNAAKEDRWFELQEKKRQDWG